MVKTHCYIIKNLNKKIGALFRTRNSLPRAHKEKIYLFTIRPAIECGNVIYDNCSMADSEKLECVHKFAARICIGAMRRTEYTKLCYDLGWQTLKSRRLIAKATLTLKIMQNKTPSYLKYNFFAKIDHANLRQIKIL